MKLRSIGVFFFFHSFGLLPMDKATSVTLRRQRQHWSMLVSCPVEEPTYNFLSTQSLSSYAPQDIQDVKKCCLFAASLAAWGLLYGGWRWVNADVGLLG